MIEDLYKRIIIIALFFNVCLLSFPIDTLKNVIIHFIPYQESKTSIGINIINDNDLEYSLFFNNWFSNNLYFNSSISSLNNQNDINLRYNYSLGYVYNFQRNNIKNLVMNIGHNKSRFHKNDNFKSMIYSFVFNLNFKKYWISFCQGTIENGDNYKYNSLSLFTSIKKKILINFGARIITHNNKNYKAPFLTLSYNI